MGQSCFGRTMGGLNNIRQVELMLWQIIACIKKSIQTPLQCVVDLIWINIIATFTNQCTLK